MAQMRAEVDKEHELLATVLTSIAERNKKMFDTWELMLKKLNRKKSTSGNRRARHRTKTLTEQNNHAAESSGSGDEKKIPQKNYDQPDGASVSQTNVMPPPTQQYPRDPQYPTEMYQGYRQHNPSPPGGQSDGSTYNPSNMVPLVQQAPPLIQQRWNPLQQNNLVMTNQNTPQAPSQVQTQQVPQNSTNNANGPPSVISEPPVPNRNNQNFLQYPYYTNPMNPPQQPNLGSLTGLGNLVPQNIQRGMQQGFGNNDTALHFALQLLQNLENRPQPAPVVNQQMNNLTSMMSSMNSEISPAYYTQPMTQNQPQTAGINQGGQNLSASMQAQQLRAAGAGQQAAQGDGQSAEPARNQAQQPQQQGQPSQAQNQQMNQAQAMNQPQATHSQLNLNHLQQQQARPQQVLFYSSTFRYQIS